MAWRMSKGQGPMLLRPVVWLAGRGLGYTLFFLRCLGVTSLLLSGLSSWLHILNLADLPFQNLKVRLLFPVPLATAILLMTCINTLVIISSGLRPLTRLCKGITCHFMPPSVDS